MAPKPGFSITKNYRWLASAFGRSLTPDSTADMPDLVLPTIRPQFDALGWNRLAQYETEETVGAPDDTQTFIGTNTVEGEVLFVFHMSMRNEDSVARNFTFFYDAVRGSARTPAGPRSIPLAPTVSIPTFEWGALLRSQPVFSGDRLQFDVDTLTLGASYRSRIMFVRIPEDEYIPFPY